MFFKLDQGAIINLWNSTGFLKRFGKLQYYKIITNNLRRINNT